MKFIKYQQHIKYTISTVISPIVPVKNESFWFIFMISDLVWKSENNVMLSPHVSEQWVNPKWKHNKWFLSMDSKVLWVYTWDSTAILRQRKYVALLIQPTQSEPAMSMLFAKYSVVPYMLSLCCINLCIGLIIISFVFHTFISIKKIKT